MIAFHWTYDSVIIEISYLLSKLSHVAATNIANTFKTIIDSVLADPLRPMGKLDTVSPWDWPQISTWNTAVREKCDACVHHFIEGHALRNPDSPAIHSHDGLLTYSELDHISTQIAKKLIIHGVGPEVLVPVCFEKSMWAVVAMVAILKAGGAFVPLDPSHPVERLTAIIRRTHASVVVTSATHSGLLEGVAARTCVVGPALVDSLDKKHDNAPIEDRVRPGNAAFVLFTSGSTGQPKGIVQEHGSVCTNSLAHGEALCISPASRVLQFAAYTFDVSMMDIFTTLILGGCICVPSEYDRMNDIVYFINVAQVNWALLTPSFSNLIEPEDVQTLRTLALGGEAVTQENIQRWASKVTLLNCYGPAECGACIVSEKQIDGYTRAETVGRRLSGALCWLTDPSNHNKLVPIGAIGELCVEGPTLARGYLDDPTLTAAQFVENPLWLEEVLDQRRRIYKTGDLLRQNSNGSFDFVGRVDSQVKVRGQRVELGEVEHHLASHPAVAACVVAHPKSGQYYKCLVGVVQLQGRVGTSKTHLPSLQGTPELQVIHPQEIMFDTSQLAQYMQERLPPYMVPNVWILVDKIPLSTSAKIDRKKVVTWLTDLDREVNTSQVGNALDSATQTLLSPQEKMAIEISIKVAAIIAPSNKHLRAVIEGHNVILTDVGLDSIQAISLVMSIRQSYGIKLGIEHLTHKDTSIRDVANSIEEFRRGAHNAVRKKVDIRKEWQLLSQELKGRASARRSKGSTVLVTGATGFLGVRILSDLFSRSSIHKVIAHIRADSADAGLKRVVEAASFAGWWSETLLPRLEIWPGDLEKPLLKLPSSHWNRITGNVTADEKIDAIIHNGASVIDPHSFHYSHL